MQLGIRKEGRYRDIILHKNYLRYALTLGLHIAQAALDR